MPISSKVFTSGSSGWRCGAAMPIALSRPALMCPIRPGMSPKKPFTLPAMTSVIAGAAPL
jgi:hypothetical protein